ncbi:sensor histidine kinase KdpD [Shumkonia mesophila]|uniref:sensor histidine kinase KdpD n=1 Tax=Shumkonia mesophila TaxID=2838854 RepID=UPI0029350036|nr:sensor histidine kinase KdpD [Shumkonia mesophila]
MAEDQDRPAPDALLEEAKKEGRGHLKIFLGAYPGVGKTYAMLMAARQRRKEGLDVVVGIAETHGRIETERLLRGLEAIPRRQVEYRGRAFGEMDLDAVLARKPALVLVDEFAHTNVPGSRHEKRYQDVEELLAAGIDVYTTLNVQHIESLNDVVARISRVRVRETLPDHALEAADDIEIIDLPPDELIQRLREGKVYVRDQIGRAIRHFFSKGNLTAFRELAMRIAAERVDAQMVQYMRAHAIPGPWPAQVRLLVCVDATEGSNSLVRAGRRLAERLRAPWIVLYVRTPHHDSLDDAAKDRISAVLRLAERLGAEAVTLPAESHVAREIVSYASSRNATHIVLGRPRAGSLRHLFSERVAAHVGRRAEAFEVVTVPRQTDEEKAKRPPVATKTSGIAWRDYVWATLGVAAATFVVAYVERFFSVANLSFFFLAAVLLIASRFGLGPALYASGLSFLSFNFFFTVPYFTLRVVSEQDVFTLALFLLIAVLTGNLAARLRRQVKSMRSAARSSANLYEFSRKVAAAASSDDVLWAVVHHVASTLECRSLILLPNDGKLEIAAGYPPEDRLEQRDRAATEWTWSKGEPAGWSSDTLPAADWLFLPLRTRQGTIGVLGVSFEDRRPLEPDRRRLLDAITDQVAVTIERTNLMAVMEDTRLLNETEHLRAALLSSVSHDLKTPLASIIGSATTLADPGVTLPAKARQNLIQAILDESARLHRFVQNLLDMTRLSYGALEINRQWCDLGEIIDRARHQTEKTLSRHTLDVRLPGDLPYLRVDPLLMEHILVNLLDNAAKYAPPGTRIEIAGRAEEESLVISVTDQGPGIPEGEREAVFDQFYRVRAEDRQVAGTGLGLSICRGLIEAHGGKIAIEAGPKGKGTMVIMSLPLEAAPDVPSEPEDLAGGGA